MKIFNKKLLIICTIIGAACGMEVLSAMSVDFGRDKETNHIIFKDDKQASIKAFKQVYAVLMHPRCMNCHPAGDVPLQGDDSHLHAMLPQRGVDGRGVYTMKCNTCHASKGIGLENTPPGSPNWHLPPADMKMVFQGKSAHQLAEQLVNPEKNGHKNLKALRAHAVDALVIKGFNVGGGRDNPPLTHAEFTKAWYAWIDNGAYAPDEN